MLVASKGSIRGEEAPELGVGTSMDSNAPAPSKCGGIIFYLVTTNVKFIKAAGGMGYDS